MTSVYTITPPDIYLTKDKSILLLGIRDIKMIEEYQKEYETLYPDKELVFYVDISGITEDNIGWHRSLATIADEIIVNIENATSEEIALSSLLIYEFGTKSFWICGDNTVFMNMMQSMKFSTAVKDLEELKDFIKEHRSESNV